MIHATQMSDATDLVQRSAHVHGRIEGRLLTLQLHLHYRNEQAHNLEVVHTFPLPWGAVLLALEVAMAGERLEGVVQASDDARTRYEAAMDEGDSAVLVAVNADGSYTMELGNLLPGEECSVCLTYAQMLAPQQGNLRLMLPTTLAPRYGDPIADAGLPPHAVPEVSAMVEYPFTLELDIHGPLASANLSSPSHEVIVSPQAGDGTCTRVCLRRRAWLDRDFVLVFDDVAQHATGLVAPDALEPGRSTAMLTFTPRLPAHEECPVTLKLLLDCSGSMHGDSIQAARLAVIDILDQLREGDRFSISRFGSSVEHRCPRLWRHTEAAAAAARRWVEALQADLGGTEMDHAIASTLALGGDARADVLLVTDGEIHAIDRVLERARASGQRFFVVGIGSSVSEGLLRRLAWETGGSCEFVAPGEAVQAAVQRLYRRMRASPLRDVRLQWHEGLRVLTATQLPGSVFAGDDIIVFAQLEGAGAAGTRVALMGTNAQGDRVCLGQARLEPCEDASNTLARLGASRFCQELADLESTPRSQLQQMAVRYQLVTGETHLILVKARADEEKPTDMPRLHSVKGMLAAGWGGTGTVSSFDIVLPCVASVRRSPKMSRKSVRAVRLSLRDDFDMPAFLRQDVPHEREPLSPPDSPDYWYSPSNHDWGAGEHERLLTPAGLARWLRNNRRAFWPASYEALAQMPIDRNIVEWLQFVVAQGSPEADVVRAFLVVVLQLAGGNRLVDSLRTLRVDEALRVRLHRALSPLDPLHWPASVREFVEDA